jgi:alanyl-tRNA synthetase
MKRILVSYAFSIVLIIVSYPAAFSQGFISLKRNTVKKQLIRFYNKQPVTFSISETDSSITAIVTDTAEKNTSRFSYYFKQNSRCYKETGDGDCGHCFQKIISDAKMVKRYKWKKISNDFFLSKPIWNLALMRSNPDLPFSYMIVKNYLKRTDHQRLYKLHL